jgi:hypothetical protein
MENNFELPVMGGKLTANDKDGLTIRKVFKTMNILYPTILNNNSSLIQEPAIVEKFKFILNSFAYPAGEIRWNFLSERRAIILENGVYKYRKPDNYDRMIAVYIDKDCGLCSVVTNLELPPRDLEKTNFDNNPCYYLENGYFVFSIPAVENQMDICGCCKVCDNCKKFEGKINLHYFMTARQPDSMDDVIEWLPSHPNVKDYFVLRLAEEIKKMIGAEPFGATDYQQMNDKLNSIIASEKYTYQINNKTQRNNKLLDFSKVNSQFR